MAVAKGTHVAARRFVYGFNVLLQIALAAAAVVALVWFAQSFKSQIDLTRSGVNSLSPRTMKLLDRLDSNIRITGLYTVLSEYDERAQKRQDRVRDLLKLYEINGHGNVTADLVDPMKDLAQFQELLTRLKDKPAYADEAQMHRTALAEFPTLLQRVQETLSAQVAEAQRMTATAASEGSVLFEVARELERIVTRAENATAEVEEFSGAEIPQYARAVESARSYFELVTEYLKVVRDWVTQKGPSAANLSPDGLAFLQRAVTEHEPLIADLDAFIGRTRTLESTELEELGAQINRWANAPPIIVESADRAEVLAFMDVWPFRRGGVPGPDGDDRDFAGEQSVSSAILKLTQDEKTAVVFTRYGGESPITPDFSQMNMMMRQMPRAPYGTLNELLEKQNFITYDWDVKTQKEVPQIEDAARTIYVVFPPTPPPQTDPRRPSPEPAISPEDVQLVTDAIDQSGMAIFLTGWIPPQGPMPGMGTATYEYADYLRNSWGIDVEYEHIVLPFSPSPENPNLYVPTRKTQAAVVETPTLTFTDHPITAPLQATAGGLDATCPLEIVDEGAPDNVEVAPLVELSDTQDTWAIKDLQQLNDDFRNQQGTRPRDADIRAPFALALAAQKGEDQRLVAFASKTFVSDRMLDQPGGFVLTDGGLQTYAAYPANSDLFINTLHWLTNDADRISVGVQQTDIPRLTKLKNDAWLRFWQIFLVGIWPGMALVVGGGVWLMRRR